MSTGEAPKSELGELLGKLPVGIAIFDAEDRLLFWNPAYVEMFPEEAATLGVGVPYEATLRLFYEANLSDRETGDIERHIASGLERHRGLRNYQYQKRDGRWFEVSAHRLSDGRMLKIWTDVTRSRVHGASKSRLDDALAAIDVGIAIYDQRGRYLLSNKALDEIFPSSVELHRPGASYEDHLADYVANAVASGEGFQLARLLGRAEPQGRTLERGHVLRTQDRRYLTLDEHVGAGGDLFTVWRDVTDDQRNQRLLQDGMNLLEQIAKNAELPTVLTLTAAMVEDHCRSIDCIAVLFEGNRIYLQEPEDHDVAPLRAATNLALRGWDENDPDPPKGFEHFVDRFDREANRFRLAPALRLPLGPENEPPVGALIGITRTPGAELDPVDRAIMERAVKLANVAIEHDRRARAVQDARESAEIANRAKSDFLAKMSHELRTPLNAIIGFAEMMTAGIGGDLPERHQEYASMIRQSGQHLLSIINDILDISRIESGHAVLNEEICSLCELWRESAELVRPRAEIRRIAIRDERLEDVSVLCDPTKIRQCLLNLLSNAVKYSEDGTFVEATIETTAAGSVEISVIDRGCGMSEEQVSMALRPFVQVDPTRLTERTGIGLGLPISKALMELHSGVLELRSEIGIGTTAVLSFPPWRRLPMTTGSAREIA